MNKKWNIQVNPKAVTENILQGEKYRITMLTEGLIRLEYSESGIFEDRATQCVWNRNFPKVAFTYKETEEQLEIFTSMIHLIYDKKKFSPNGLSIQVVGNFSAYGSIWHYGQDFQDLKGTARTLDEADGEIPLDRGIIGRNGFSVLDDSRSLLLCEDGWIEPRTHQEEDLYFWGYGHGYKKALKDFYYLCGKSPMIPRYALGNWWSRYYKYTEESYKELMNRFEKEKIPFSVAVIDMDWHLVDIDPKYGSGWTGYTWNRDLFPDPEEFLQWLHNRNMRVTLNVHPADGVRAHEEQYRAVAEEMGVDWGEEQPVNFDPTDPCFLEACFKHIYRPMEEQGVDFWWLDWQSGGLSKVEGLDPLWVLNHYHYLDSGREGKRPMTFSRYAGPGSHRYPVGFSGDTIVTWASLAFQPYFTATASNIGYGMWSHDIGGHMMGIKDDEMAGRWLQFGVFSPIMRLHSSNSEFNAKEPWRYRKDIADMMKDFLRLRHRMVPYLYTMNRRAYEEDLPIVLPMYYDHPEEREAYDVPNQYFFGSQLLCAPITDPQISRLNVGKIKTWLPKGIWYDVFTGMRYRGGRKMNMYRGLSSFPVLAKAGAIVPMTEELDSIQKNPEKMCLHVYPGANGSFVLYEDDSETEDYKKGKFVKTSITFSWNSEEKTAELVIKAPQGCLEFLPEKRSWKVIFHGIEPCQTEAAAELSRASFPETTVRILAAGENKLGEITYDREKASLCCELGEQDPVQEIRILLRNIREKENDTAAYAFDFLNQAEIEFVLKDTLYQMVREEEDKIMLLSQLQAMELDPELLGVLTEIITA